MSSRCSVKGDGLYKGVFINQRRFCIAPLTFQSCSKSALINSYTHYFRQIDQGDRRTHKSLAFSSL